MAKTKRMTAAELAAVRIPSPRCHFLDSGSFALWARATAWAKERNVGEWEFYETDEFEKYLEDYAKFCLEHKIGIDLCANVDVLPFKSDRVPPPKKTSHELSYQNLKRLEKKGLQPVPVVHYDQKTDHRHRKGLSQNSYVIFEYLDRYVAEGYPLVGLGGLVGSISNPACERWIEDCFTFLCGGTEDHTPCVKVHGFGVTSHKYLLKFPWYSVDSTTWTKHGAYGHVLVPKLRQNRRTGQKEFLFTLQDFERMGLQSTHKDALEECQPFLITFSKDSKKVENPNGSHYLRLRPNQRECKDKWMKHINIDLGCEKTEGVGAITDFNYRRRANLFFFEELREHLPDYCDMTWKFKEPGNTFGQRVPTFAQPPDEPLPRKIPKSDKLIIFYSGSGSIQSGPEADLGRRANLMLTFHDFHKSCKPDSRFKRILKARKRQLKLRRKRLHGRSK